MGTNVSQWFISFSKPHLSVLLTNVVHWLKSVTGATGIIHVHQTLKPSHSEGLAHWPSHDRTLLQRWFSMLLTGAQNPLPNILISSPLAIHCLQGGPVNTNNTIDMWDRAFWSITAEWLRLRSCWILFWIIPKSQSEAYQWFHPPVPMIDMPTWPSCLPSRDSCLLEVVSKKAVGWTRAAEFYM